MPHEIKVGDVYKNKIGRSVRIVCTDRKGHPYPVVGLLDRGHKETVELYTKSGAFIGESSSYDLILHAGPYDDWQVDDPIWVWETDADDPLPRYFAGIANDGRVLAWIGGATSYSNVEEQPLAWNYASKTKPSSPK
jgi:hypothetical protein